MLFNVTQTFERSEFKVMNDYLQETSWQMKICGLFFPHERHYIFSGNHDIICFHLPENFTRPWAPFFFIYLIVVSHNEKVSNIKMQIKCMSSHQRLTFICCFSFPLLHMCFPLSLLFAIYQQINYDLGYYVIEI